MFDFLKKDKNEVVSPITGTCIDMVKVPDKVFSSKVLGDGFAVIPTGNVVVAPVDGEIVMIPESKHAFGMKTRSGAEVLVHIGLDTVELNGEGFTLKAECGNKVKAGTPLITFDSEFMAGRRINMITMVIFTDGYEKEIQLDCYDSTVSAGQVLFSMDS